MTPVELQLCYDEYREDPEATSIAMDSKEVW